MNNFNLKLLILKKRTVMGLGVGLVAMVSGAALAAMVPTTPSAATAAATAAKPAVVEPAKELPTYKTYVYYGDRYRDPFIPLNGDFRNDPTGNDRPPQVSSLVLKGIVQDSKGRMALITSGLSSYVLKGGRLYDGRNRMVKKIAGVIKTDSVVIIGADRTVVELKTKAPL